MFIVADLVSLNHGHYTLNFDGKFSNVTSILTVYMSHIIHTILQLIQNSRSSQPDALLYTTHNTYFVTECIFYE